MGDLALTLLVAAVSVGALHSLAPDHWIPIAAVGRARGWSTARTARVTLLCGAGHVSVSVALGLLGLITGRAAMESLGSRAASLSGLLLIGFGIAYLVSGARHALAGHLHGHHHSHYDHVHDESRRSVWSLFAIYCADPCVAVIPILFAAAPLSAGATAAIVVAYEAATIAAMVALVAVARASAGVLQGRWIERWADSTAGGAIVVTGAAVALLGW
jgi:hypothetical protein